MEEGRKGELAKKMGGLCPLPSVLRYAGANGPFCRFGRQFGDFPRDTGELEIGPGWEAGSSAFSQWSVLDCSSSLNLAYFPGQWS